MHVERKLLVKYVRNIRDVFSDFRYSREKSAAVTVGQSVGTNAGLYIPECDAAIRHSCPGYHRDQST